VIIIPKILRKILQMLLYQKVDNSNIMTLKIIQVLDPIKVNNLIQKNIAYQGQNQQIILIQIQDLENMKLIEEFLNK